VHELWHCASCSDNAKSGQQEVPEDEWPAKFVARSISHKLLAGEDDQHIYADIVKADGPVRSKPHLGVRVLELIFELEDVGVVGHRHHLHAVHLGRRRRIGYFQHGTQTAWISHQCVALLTVSTEGQVQGAGGAEPAVAKATQPDQKDEKANGSDRSVVRLPTDLGAGGAGCLLLLQLARWSCCCQYLLLLLLVLLLVLLLLLKRLGPVPQSREKMQVTV